MSARTTTAALERLRVVVSRGLGLNFDENNLDLLASALQERLDAVGDPPDRYVSRLENGAGRGELRALAERLTVGETYFFRSPNDLAALVEVVLPARMRERAATRRLRILSAGCSSGEEPCTIAMLVRDLPQLASWQVAIHAVDVNPAAIARAASGRYSEWALRQTPPELQARFFRSSGREFVLDESVRRMVTFEERNLVAADDEPWHAGTYDVVFCRNVTMYFARDVARQVVERIARSLAPGGYLFLGHAETLRGISTAFHLHQSHGTFYYQVREPEEARSPAPPAAALAPAAELVDASASWVDAIRRASARIAQLAEPAPPNGARPAPAPRAPGAASPQHALLRALELVRDERYADALALLPAAVSGAHPDPDSLLLRAVLLAISGAVAEARAVCGRILERDELNAEAHYVMALCAEHDQDGAAALTHDRYAVYLDAAFAMPRLHLGLMARRAGDADAARRELARALVLLAHEDASRILLLGGGFTRDALVDLCSKELRACGGAS